MATTDDFLPGILPDVPGCPLPTARFHIHRAVMEFCRESGIWHEDLTPIDLVNDQRDYILPVTDGVMYRQIERVSPRVGDSYPPRLIHKTEQQLDKERPGWRMWFANLPLYYSTDVKASKVSLTATPRGMTQPTSITVHVSMLPTEDATAIPDFIAEQWREAIETGAKARILGMPSQHPWSSKQDALELRQSFLVKCDEATIVAIRESAGEGQQSSDGRAFGDYIFNL